MWRRLFETARAREAPAVPLKIRQERVAWRPVDGTYLGLDVVRGEYFALNAGAARLWPSLIAGATADELSAALVEAFEISEQMAAVDVAALLAQLEERDLLER